MWSVCPWSQPWLHRSHHQLYSVYPRRSTRLSFTQGPFVTVQPIRRGAHPCHQGFRWMLSHPACSRDTHYSLQLPIFLLCQLISRGWGILLSVLTCAVCLFTCKCVTSCACSRAFCLLIKYFGKLPAVLSPNWGSLELSTDDNSFSQVSGYEFSWFCTIIRFILDDSLYLLYWTTSFCWSADVKDAYFWDTNIPRQPLLEIHLKNWKSAPSVIACGHCSFVWSNIYFLKCVSW